jgi:hypothetical protein
MQKQNNNFKSIEVQNYLLASSATLQQAGRTKVKKRKPEVKFKILW